MQTASPPRRLVTVLRVTSGNFLEMFDFFLFGFYASHIARAFFPADTEFASVMFAFMTFGAGSLMRPLGAIVLGATIDRIGRRRGLIITLSIMAIGTALIALVPDFETIGWPAPALVLAGRLLQGFSAGVELGGVSVYLFETAPPGQKGFYVSWQSASQQVAVMAAALIGYALNTGLSAAQVDRWGWRVPFFVGCSIVPLILMLRRSLQESPEFLARRSHPGPRQMIESIVAGWRTVGAGVLLVVMTTVSFYLITVYTPTFGSSVLKLDRADSLAVTFCVAVSNFVWLPVMGALSDRVGRRPLLVTFTVLTMATAYPALSWLAREPDFGKMLMVELWLSFLYASYNGAMVVTLTEVMPVQVRTSGFSLAYSVANALFGGFTPAVSTWLIQATADKAAPGLWMSIGAASGLAGTWLLWRRRGEAPRGRSEQ